MDLQLPQQSYQSRSRPFSSERLLNLIFEKAPNSNKFMLIGTPGLKEYYDLEEPNNNPILGMIYIADCLVYVTNTGIYIIRRDSEGNISLVTSKPWRDFYGANATLWPTSRVQMESNGQTVMLLNPNAKKLYYIDLIDTNVASPDSWVIGAVVVPEGSEDAQYTSLSYISGVFVAACQISNNSYIQYTEVLGHEMFYAFQLDTTLTNLSALSSNMRELWCFGANSIEVVAPTGESGNDFFAHVQGAYANKGCVCKNSITVYETVFFFYATNGAIYAAENYASLKQISTPALLDTIKSWGTLDTQEERDGVIGQV